MDIDMAALRALEREREIPMDVIVPAIEQALLLAYQKEEGSYRRARVELDRRTGHVVVWAREDGEVDEDGLRGDVAPDVWDVAGHVSPNPGGVGPMTITCLLANTLTATARVHGLPESLFGMLPLPQQCARGLSTADRRSVGRPALNQVEQLVPGSVVPVTGAGRYGRETGAGALASSTVRGQYAPGWQGGEEVGGYLDERGVDPQSSTETFAAVRLEIDTRRWAGVPFYLRTGKRLAKRVTEIAVVFKTAPHLPFSDTETEELGQNAIVIRVQPDEGVTMRFGAKVPGAQMEVRDVTMDFGYGRAFTESSPEAYERLILDVLLGDPPLFPRHEEVELSWAILDPIEEHWARQKSRLPQYPAGEWGPEEADEMMARDGRTWRMP